MKPEDEALEDLEPTDVEAEEVTGGATAFVPPENPATPPGVPIPYPSAKRR